VGETTASHLSFYSALVEVVAAAFGGKDGNKAPVTEDLSEATPEQFASRFMQLMSV